MDLNSDFDVRAVVHAAQIPWQPSPMKGVDRRMLDRLGDEVARATSIVRYAPGSHFSSHVHTGGEEYLVLEGVFQDEHGDFPVGTYVRNPPDSSHTPGSEQGCTIFVKLWQFDMADRIQVRVDTITEEYKFAQTGVQRLELHSDDNEQVCIEKWDAGTEVPLDASYGMEALVLKGGFDEAGHQFSTHSWLRLPKGSSTVASAGRDGARVWIKRNHLAETPNAPTSAR